MKKKNYNPFMMFGSYLGAIIINFIKLDGNFLFNSWNTNIIFGFLLTLAGFEIGWGIHSLIRSLRK